MNKCLIVDDAIAACMATRRLAEKLELQVREAENGHAAIRLCLRRTPDIILLDWSMPGMDGYTFLQTLRRMPRGDRPKVIFCTARHAAHTIHQAIAAIADEFIMKSFDSDILLSKLIQFDVLIPDDLHVQDSVLSIRECNAANIIQCETDVSGKINPNSQDVFCWVVSK